MANETVEKAYREVTEALSRLRNVIDQHEAVRMDIPKDVSRPQTPQREGQEDKPFDENDPAYKGQNPDGMPIGQMSPDEVNRIRSQEGKPSPVSADGSFIPPKEKTVEEDKKTPTPKAVEDKPPKKK